MRILANHISKMSYRELQIYFPKTLANIVCSYLGPRKRWAETNKYNLITQLEFIFVCEGKNKFNIKQLTKLDKYIHIKTFLIYSRFYFLTMREIDDNFNTRNLSEYKILLKIFKHKSRYMNFAR